MPKSSIKGMKYCQGIGALGMEERALGGEKLRTSRVPGGTVLRYAGCPRHVESDTI